jgi:hypothetical protein
MSHRRRTTVIAGSAIALALALSGCTGSETVSSTSPPVDTATSSGTPTPEETPTATPAESVVREYLAAIAAEDSAAAWALLTPEAQGFYGGDSEVYATWFGRDGITTAEEARSFADADLTEAEGPEGAFTLVSASTESAADAWVVRDAGGGLLIDDAGVPPTGSAVYEWRNPASGTDDDVDAGEHDAAAPASLWFASPLAFDSEEPSTLGYPDTVWAYADGTEVPATLGPASDAGRLFEVAPNALATTDAPLALTVVWQVGEDSAGWRSTTTLLP